MCSQMHSHSTMYLLKHPSTAGMSQTEYNSHSTMYLLKRICSVALLVFVIVFTFHHVSIKTVATKPKQYEQD